MQTNLQWKTSGYLKTMEGREREITEVLQETFGYDGYEATFILFIVVMVSCAYIHKNLPTSTQ